MESNFKQFCADLNTPEPSGDLFDRIILRIEEEKKLIAIRRRIVILALVLVASIGAMIPSLSSLMENLSSSGFTRFLSLLFSDGGAVLSYWQSFSLALLESLPVINVAIMLAIILAFLVSCRFMFKDIKKFNSLKLA